MAEALARFHIPEPPPGEDDLPYDDGEPLETDAHRRQMNILIDSLELAWKDRQDFHVGGNMFIYFSELQAKKNDFRGPDVFVVLDTVRRQRKSWVVWGEGGRTPNVVIELISPSTEAIDRGEKMRIYGKILHVPEYYLYDPVAQVLEGYTLDATTGTYSPMSATARGDLPCASLGLRLGIRHSINKGVEGDWLRWIDTNGRVLPLGDELAETAQKQAETERERAEAAQKQAEELAARLAEYEKKFGPLRGEKT